jgi:thiamine kinase
MQSLLSPCLTDPPAALKIAVEATLPLLHRFAWTPLSGGRVNRLWRVGTMVIKLYNLQGASPLFPNDPKAEALALRFVAPTGLAPKLRAVGEGWIAYDHLEARKSKATPTEVAEALNNLHNLPAGNIALRIRAGGSAELLHQAQQIAALCQTMLPPPPADPGIAAPQLSVIHGDAVPGNFIATSQRLCLIDWQCPAIGDPAEDIAAWLSPAMQWLYGNEMLTPSEANEFLQAFPAQTVERYRALAPLFHWRMAAHCLWKAERGDEDYDHALQLELAALAAI